MITLEKTPYGYLLGFYQDRRKQFIPCGTLIEVELEAYRNGLTLKDDAKIWHNLHNGGDCGQSSV